MENKKAQEEIVGFAMIVIIVSIILVFFLIFSLSDKTSVESYESSSFLMSSLQYTSKCEGSYENLSIQGLIISCYKQEKCLNEQDSCAVMNQEISSILEEIWKVGGDFPAKGYKLDITAGEESLASIIKGNSTGNYKEAQQILPEGDIPITITFRTYS